MCALKIKEKPRHLNQAAKVNIVSFAGLFTVNGELTIAVGSLQAGRSTPGARGLESGGAVSSISDENSAAISRRAAAILGSQVDLAYLSSVAAWRLQWSLPATVTFPAKSRRPHDYHARAGDSFQPPSAKVNNFLTGATDAASERPARRRHLLPCWPSSGLRQGNWKWSAQGPLAI